MNRWIIAMVWAAVVPIAFPDQLIRNNGEVVEGRFAGFAKHQWVFTTDDGNEVKEFSSNIKRIIVNPAPTVSVELVNERLDSVLFKGYDKFAMSFQGASGNVNSPATLLKSMTVIGGEAEEMPVPESAPKAAPEPVPKAATEPAPKVAPERAPTPAPEPAPKAVSESAPVPYWDPPATPVEQIVKTVPGAKAMMPKPASGTREWKQTGKWRELQVSGAHVISESGEDVDIESQLKKDVVNVVHFHYAAAHSSVRQGNYLEVLARKSNGRVVIHRIVVPGWNAPVCVAKGVKSLPQFWFYNREGELSSKLTDRFTENDIDTALKKALR